MGSEGITASIKLANSAAAVFSVYPALARTMREDWESHSGQQPGAEPWHTRHFGTMSRAQQNLEIYKVTLWGY